MSRQLKLLIKQQRKDYRKQVFNTFYQTKLKEECDTSDLAIGVMSDMAWKINLTPFFTIGEALPMFENMAEASAFHYACEEMAKRGLS